MINNLFKTQKIIFLFVVIVLVLFISKTVFAVWSGTFYEPGDTLNPECLPTQTDCDVRSPLTSINISDTAYDATTWNGVTTIAPSKDAIRDKLENLGAITPTTVNGLTITSNGTNTLNITAGKTLTVSNTLTLAGTDSSTLNIGTGGTLGSNAFTSTAYAPLASPTFTTNITTPLIIGGTSTTSDLNLKTTSGIGATGADMHFLVGNNGATEAMTILNSGNVGIRATDPSASLYMRGRATQAGTGTMTDDGSGNITGTDTLFTTELHVGDVITNLNNGNTAIVTTITDDTNMVVSNNLNDVNFGFTYQQPIANFVQSDGTTSALTLLGTGGAHVTSTLGIGTGYVPQGQLRVAGASQGLMYISQLDAGANEKNWYFDAEGGDLYWGTNNDTFSGGANYARISRTGVNIDAFEVMYGYNNQVWFKQDVAGIQPYNYPGGPTARWHIRAGSTAASSAPLKIDSGSLMTTPEVGAVEFLTDAFYGTITTGAVRKTFAFLESPTFTGTVTIPTPFTLGAVSVTSTGTQLNYLNGATGTTGTASTNLVFSTSPTLITPALGTPSALVLTNATGLPAAAVLAGTFGTGAYVMDTTLTVPTILGGTGTTSDLNLKTTSGVGAAGADMHFLVGNNGATEAMTILNSGNVGISMTAPLLKLDVDGSARFSGTATSELTGDIDPIASTTVTGTSTLFLTELVVGDRITVTGETRTVTAIASDTSLTVDTAFTDGAIDTAPDKLPAIFIARDSSDTVQMYINDAGLTTINNLETGPLNFDEDAGAVSWVDMSVTSSASDNTVESYSAQIDGTPILTVYGQSDGAGGADTLRVGISTTTPQSLLDIQGPTGTGTATAGILTLATKELTIVDGDELGRINFNSPLESDGTDAILAGAAIWAEADDTFSATVNSSEIVFGTATTSAAIERMRIDSAGNVGIGTTTPTNILSLGNDAARKFWIENTATDVVGRALTVAAGGTVAGTSVSNVVGGNLILQSGLGTGTGDSSISFQTGTTLTTGTTLQTMSTKMTILGNGNVGIGTTAPTSPLSFTTSTGSKIGLYEGLSYGLGVQSNLLQIYHPGPANRIGLGYGTSAAFTEVLSVTNGSVGIGTVAPSELLEVSKSVAAATDNYVLALSNSVSSVADERVGLRFWANSTKTAGAAISVANDGATGGDISIKTMTSGTDTTRIFVDASTGNVGISTTSPGVAGDGSTVLAGKILDVTNSAGQGRLLSRGSTGGRLDLIDSGGASNDKHLALTVDGGIGWFKSIDDVGSGTVVDNILVMDLSSGYVGIGTAAPGATLDIGTTSSTGNYIRVLGSSTDTTYTVFSGQRQYPKFELVDTTVGGSTFNFWNLGNSMRFGTATGTIDKAAFSVGAGDAGDSRFNGNLTLGTYAAGVLTNPRNATITGRPYSGYPITVGSLTLQGFGATSASTNNDGGVLSLASGISTGSGTSYINFLTSTAGSSGTSDVNPTEKMRITGAGNVGISTTIPQSLLDVQGPTGTGTATAGILTLATKELTIVDGDELGRINFNAPLESDGTDSILAGAAIWAEADDTFSTTVNSSEIVFGTATTSAAIERMRIDSAGFVGIGNSSPGVLLHVGSTAVTDASTLLRLEDANSTCNFTADAGAPTCGSDRSLKKDITILNNSDILNKITKLDAVSYHWLTDDENSPIKYGFIAQNVQEQFPNLVTEGTWGDGSQKLFLSMGGLMPYAIGAIKELDLKITNIEELNNFEKENTWRDSLIAWFENSTNRITRIFTGEVCLTSPGEEAVCLNRTELQSLKALINQSGSTPGPEPIPEPAPAPAPEVTPTPDETPTPTPDETTPEPEPIPEVTPEPAPAPEPAPTPEPEPISEPAPAPAE